MDCEQGELVGEVSYRFRVDFSVHGVSLSLWLERGVDNSRCPGGGGWGGKGGVGPPPPPARPGLTCHAFAEFVVPFFSGRRVSGVSSPSALVELSTGSACSVGLSIPRTPGGGK